MLRFRRGFDYYTHDEPVEAMSSWVTRPLAIDNLKELLKNTVHLSLAGGEVTVTAEAMDFLRHCSKSGISRRFPAKWSTIQKNFEKLLAAPPNVIPVLAPTVQIYNVLGIAELFSFFEKYKSPKWSSNTFCHITTLYSPMYLSVRNLPKAVRGLALSRIQSFCEKSHYARVDRNFIETLDLLIGTLKDQPSDNAQENLSYFMQYTRLLDESRKQKFEEYLPELAQLLAAEKIIPSYPKGADGRSFSFFRHKEAGWLYQKKNKHEEALKMFSKALAEDGADSDALFSKGISLKALQKLEDAEACFRKLYLLTPGHYYNLVELGMIEKAKSRPKEAVRLFREAKSHEPFEQKGQRERLIQDCLASLA